MKIKPGDYIVGYTREIGAGLEHAKSRTRFDCREVGEYKSMLVLYGVTSPYSVHVPELNRRAQVPARPASCVIARAEPDAAILIASRKLGGDDIYLEDPQTRDRMRILNSGICRDEKCSGCALYHGGPVDPLAWTREHHMKKSRIMVDRFYGWKKAGDLEVSTLLK